MKNTKIRITAFLLLILIPIFSFGLRHCWNDGQLGFRLAEEQKNDIKIEANYAPEPIKRIPVKNQFEELGNVNWLRNYDEAVAVAKKEKKPILILFQEIPGCATCRNYGHNVLSNQLMVDAIESEFVPLAIHNNKNGHDKNILEKYNEPSWNNPVVHLVDASGKDIVQAVRSDYSLAGLSRAMINALNKENESIPAYLNILFQEQNALASGQTETAYFKLYCFWSGEVFFGNQKGVLATETGFIKGSEIVKVVFNPSETSINVLNKAAAQAKAQQVTGNYSKAPADQQKYQLLHSLYKKITMTDLQKTKVNSAIGNGENPKVYLSPSQLGAL